MTPHPALTKLIQIAWGNQATGNVKFNKTVIYMGVLSTGKLKAHRTDFPTQSWVCWPEAKPHGSFSGSYLSRWNVPWILACPSQRRCGSTVWTAVWPGNPSLNKHTYCTQTVFQQPGVIPICLDGIFPCTPVNRYLLRDTATRLLRGFASHPIAYRVRHFY